MREKRFDPPEERDGVVGWRFDDAGATALFLGRGTPAERSAPLPAGWLPRHVERARLKQVHGDVVQEARPGPCGEGDALVTARPHLALEIATADCVPVLLVGGAAVAAAHAGWRGIASRIVPAAVAALVAVDPGPVRALIGPSIGPCCYEVDEDVAHAVAASAPGVDVVAARSARDRPMLDLTAAVEAQLRAAGVANITSLDLCTRCQPQWLWSYRRDGAGAGRNLALIWRE